MGIGHLRINVFGSDQGRPEPETKLTVKKTESGEQVAEAMTNISGKSDIMELESPPIDYSLEPNSQKPYAEYDVIAEKDGFERIIIKGAQILPNVVAEQNIYLITKKNGSDENVTYPVPEHTLYGEYPSKIEEDETKPISNPTGFVILSEPAVPEYIIVHDGVPTDISAKNYWIPYKDYIKNVCSSEIYPTWPAECIKANILAINSFTLNRVYTEWYRSRGYSFTITSSTAYDQKFVYQRNIFNEISVIVDEIFSSYITKPNIEQPLFTQYCDGQRVTCPNWLSQWGSKYLADNGANYIDILKNYYGYEIYLEMANQISGVPSSYPGYVLQDGTRGMPVQTVQNQLNAISKNYPAINKIAVDGIYGPATIKSVETFQSIFNMPQTGIVDYATWYEISKIYAAVSKLS
ncbi:MAG: peptidoglycan-binding protein [Oscillospiraceae bacterium]|jgi:hypothetical protein|nr:peptidoglycan-binding protein [Oscillospiraceae bacterium]